MPGKNIHRDTCPESSYNLARCRVGTSQDDLVIAPIFKSNIGGGIKMSHFNKVAAVLVSLGALALGGCGGSSSDSSTVSVDTAKAAAVASFAKAINAAGNSISTVTNNSTATRLTAVACYR